MPTLNLVAASGCNSWTETSGLKEAIAEKVVHRTRIFVEGVGQCYNVPEPESLRLANVSCLCREATVLLNGAVIYFKAGGFCTGTLLAARGPSVSARHCP